MKNLLPTFVVSLSLVALAGCASDPTHVASQNESASLSSDSKNMTSSTVTTTSTDVAPASNQQSSTTQTDTEPSYPAIHSNGQH